MPISVAKELIDSLMYTDDERDDKLPEQKKKKVAAVLTQVPGARKDQSAELRDRQQVKVVKPAGYQSFDEPAEFSSSQGARKSNFDLINDIPLQVTVELGKAIKNLSEVLNFGTGSIIVLDKQAGDLVDVIVNGKRIAKGEVVVIDENYGVRITEILKT
jgi:flagellar motor switch protein FliN/FliY